MEDTELLNRRYSLAGWGALLVWIGAVSFLPGSRLPLGLGLLGIGTILLGIHAARRLIHKIPANGTDTALGVMVITLGAAELFRSLVPIPAGLIATGLVLLVRSRRARSRAAMAG